MNKLKCYNDSAKLMVEFFIGLPETCNHFPMNPETDYEEECDDRVYIDGNITFDTMAEIVDYLRATNPKER